MSLFMQEDGQELDAFRQELDPLDRLIEEAARALTAAEAPADLEARLKMRAMTMHTAAPFLVGEGHAVEALGRPMSQVRDMGHPELSRVRPMRVALFGSLDRDKTAARDQRSFLGAALLHAAALALIAIGVHAATRTPVLVKPMAVSVLVPPPLTPTLPAKMMVSTGGGGHTGPKPVTQGNPPRPAPVQLVPLEQPRLAQPKLAVEPTVDIATDLKMARTETEQFGVANAPAVGMSLGNGHGTGLGEGAGAGLGRGANGGTGGGSVRHVGGGVLAPVVVFAPEAEFSEEARKAKFGGNVLVYLEVDTAGRPTKVRVLRGIGMGLDEKAVAAVRQYRFRPAMEAGKPVPVEMTVDVNFAIF